MIIWSNYLDGGMESDPVKNPFYNAAQHTVDTQAQYYSRYDEHETYDMLFRYIYLKAFEQYGIDLWNLDIRSRNFWEQANMIAAEELGEDWYSLSQDEKTWQVDIILDELYDDLDLSEFGDYADNFFNEDLVGDAYYPNEECMGFGESFVFDNMVYVVSFDPDKMVESPVSGKIGYGGDFFESVTDPFCPRFMCLNGIVNHELTVKPAGAEMAFIYRPVFIEKSEKGYIIKNRNLFTSLPALRLTWTAYADGEAQSTGELLLPALEPMTEHRFEAGPARLPGQVCWIDMDLDTDGDEPLSFQFPIDALPLPLRKGRYSLARFNEARGEISVTGDGFTLQLLKSSGNIVSLAVGGKEYMLSGLSECLIRGLSGLNAGPDWGEWDNFSAFVPENCVRRIMSLSASALSDGRVMIERASRLTSTLIDEACADVTTRLLISGDGRINLEACFRLSGIKCVERLGLSFTLPGDFQHLEWLGMGPGESYPDRCLASRMGVYACEVAETHFQVVFMNALRSPTEYQIALPSPNVRFA